MDGLGATCGGVFMSVPQKERVGPDAPGVGRGGGYSDDLTGRLAPLGEGRQDTQVMAGLGRGAQSSRSGWPSGTGGA